jgi:hypothetical protein
MGNFDGAVRVGVVVSCSSEEGRGLSNGQVRIGLASLYFSQKIKLRTAMRNSHWLLEEGQIGVRVVVLPVTAASAPLGSILHFRTPDGCIAPPESPSCKIVLA